MTNRLARSLYSYLIKVQNQQIRHGHRITGSPPTIAKTLEDRLRELNYRDPEIYFKVDIGLPLKQTKNKEMRGEWTKEINEKRKKPMSLKEKDNHKLSIDLNVAKNDWLKTTAPTEIRKIAEHYGIFSHLFGDAYFHPVIPLDIEFNSPDEELKAKAFRGNFISARETCNAPTVKYKAETDTLWSLLLTTPDGNLSKSDLEICHWFIGNIPGNSIEKGDLLVNYLGPIPPRGIGYCRYIFILYKQEKRIDFSEFRKEQPCLHLIERNWSTLEFYRKHQDYLTPAGLSFFQTEWDASLTDFYHNVLKMRSPVFEYDFPEPYIKPQVWFPIRQPFNIYMDKYRDNKDIQKQYFMKKLKTIHPFKEDKQRPKYPNAIAFKPNEYIPSWLKLEIRKERLGQGRYREVQQ